MFSYQLPATLSADPGIHPSQSQAKWEGSTLYSPASWNHSLCHAHFGELLLRTDVMAHYGIHLYQTSTWFDKTGRGEKTSRDQQKLKLEPVFLPHSFCDLDRTRTFAEVQQPQLLETSTVSHTTKGSAARKKKKSQSKQTEHINSSELFFVRHSWESSQ